MKTHPELLVRDALASEFVQSCRGVDPAVGRLRALARWAQGAGAEPPLAEIRAEDGDPLFEGGALTRRFAALDAYARDRARRFAAALSWIEASGARGDPLECARAAWDAGLFFEVHEILEPLWLESQGEARRALQGVIMAGAALHHLCEGNLTGARGLLREAARRLAFPAPELPLDLERFASGLSALATAIEQERVRTVADVEELPALARVARPATLR